LSLGKISYDVNVIILNNSIPEQKSIKISVLIKKNLAENSSKAYH